MNRIAWLSLGIALVLSGSAEVRTWPAVEVRTAAPLAVKVNGRPVEVMRLPAPTHCLRGDNAHPYSAVFFDADCEVEVEVSGDVAMKNARILPTSRGVKPEVVDDRTLRFRAKPPFTLAVEPSGRHNALVVIANVPEMNPPKEGDPNVLYFGPGRHHRDEPIRVGSNQTLYLAPGAYVEAPVAAKGTNITVCGRGIISGAPWAWCKGPKGAGHMVQLSGQDITIRDVTLMSSYTWCLVFSGCDRALADNVKVLNGRVLNDDGIDVCNSRHVTIRNCFVRAQDDCIAPKWWCEDLLVENCALWTDVANIIRIGYECSGRDHFYRNLVFRDIDVLHQSIHKTPSTEYWAENAIFIQPANDQLFENLRFERFRFDAPEAGDLFMTIRTFAVRDHWQKHKVSGHCRNVVVGDVHFPEPLAANTMGVRLESNDPEHRVEGVRFENVTGCGPLVVAGDVRDVKIPSEAYARRQPVTAWSKARGWTVDGGTLRTSGEVASIECTSAPVRGGVVTARLTPLKPPANPAAGTTFGLRFKGPDGYWGLSFWRNVGSDGKEAPHRFEFEEMFGGRRFAQQRMTRLYSRGSDAGWEYGLTYLFSLRVTETQVEAAVFDDASGREIFAEAYVFAGQPAVVVGRPTFYTWGGTSGTVSDVAW